MILGRAEESFHGAAQNVMIEGDATPKALTIGTPRFDAIMIRSFYELR
jgi:hypothetical protein